MRQIRFQLAALGVATLLVACGGGSSPANPTITGLAATGAALANANLAAKCASGAALSGKTGADGTFSLELSGGQATPCLLQVNNGTVTLHGFATQAGHINITPLTDLVINKALGSSAASAFASFDVIKAAAIAVGLDLAKAYVKAEVTALTGAAPPLRLATSASPPSSAPSLLSSRLRAKPSATD